MPGRPLRPGVASTDTRAAMARGAWTAPASDRRLSGDTGAMSGRATEPDADLRVLLFGPVDLEVNGVPTMRSNRPRHPGRGRLLLARLALAKPQETFGVVGLAKELWGPGEVELTRLRGHSTAWAARPGQRGCPDAKDSSAVSTRVPSPGARVAAGRHAAEGGRRRSRRVRADAAQLAPPG